MDLKSTPEYKANFDLVSSFDPNLSIDKKQSPKECVPAFLYVLMWDLVAAYVMENMKKNNDPLHEMDIFKEISTFKKVKDLIVAGAIAETHDDIRNFVIFKIKSNTIKKGTYMEMISNDWSSVIEIIKNEYLNFKVNLNLAQ